MLARPETLSQNGGMKWGYARVSTEDQNLDLQRRALNAAGCDRLFEDQMSGASTKALTTVSLQCGVRFSIDTF